MSRRARPVRSRREFRVLGPLEVVVDGRASAPAGAKERDDPRAPAARAGPRGRDRRAARGGLARAAGPRARGALAAGPARPPARASSSRSGRGRAVVAARARRRRLPARDRPRPGRRRRASSAWSRDAGALPPAAALDAYDEALGLWRGPPVRRARLRRVRADRDPAAGGAARARREGTRARARGAGTPRGGAAGAAPAGGRRAAATRSSCGRWRLRLYRAGRQVEALDALRALGGRLRELGLEPSAETRELEQRILVHDAGSRPRPARPSSGPPRGCALPRRVSRFFGREAHLAHAGDAAPRRRARDDRRGRRRRQDAAGARVRRARAGGSDGRSAGGASSRRSRDDADVAGAVGDALGIESGSARRRDRRARRAAARAARARQLRARARGRRARSSKRCSRRCPEPARSLATSRAPLGVDGEQVLRLSGLDLPAGHAADAADSARGRAVPRPRPRRRRASSSPRPTWTRSASSAAASTGSRWRSSSPPGARAR